MVTYDALKDARFDSLRSQADTWGRTMNQLDVVVRDFNLGVCGATEHAGWKGDASGLANPELEDALRRIRVAALEARAVAAELDFAVDALSDCQYRLFAVLHAAVTDGVAVVGNGTGFTVSEARPPTAARDDLELSAVQALLDGYAQRVQAILNDAAAADALHAALLVKLSAGDIARGDEAALRHAERDLEAVFGSMTPRQTAAWWAQLTDAERQAFLVDHPHEVGAMDGVPATVRDLANRAALNSRLADLGPLVTGGTATAAELKEWENLRKIDQVMAGNTERRPEERLMLLKFGSRTRDGEVVVSVGNPDTAKNTAITVPGANTTVAGKLGEQVERATNLQRVADRITPGLPGDAAVVVWLDYDAPELSLTAWSFASGAGTGRAQDGAGRLDRFVDGTRATGPPHQHLTVGGHSYGTSVVAYAAREGDGLQADELVFVGSPGVHVDHASELGFDPDRVWVGIAPDDWEAPAAGFLHGRLPSDDDFGAHRFPTNDGGHFSYWDMRSEYEGDTSIRSQADIMMGGIP
ncbi:alpha/beta hydrolase [Yinghuangia sp. YIM S09857]|uniref:alpha/beta hydrolase n=1 Tax=Yinghuangia sp. YIM S09857 TaxID=3436929 RepID=UPI003F537E3D